jgi:formate dehydrogenase subunit gamma
MSAPVLDDADKVPRYGTVSRIVHWTIAVGYVLLMLSGFALFLPPLYWLSAIFGGGSYARILHPFIGVGFALVFFGYAAGLWRSNLLLPGDWTWLKKSRDVMMKRTEVPVPGKYNAGQKMMFWAVVVVIPVLLVTGIFIWRPYFADSFTIDTRRVSALVHAIFGFLMFVAIGIHVYAAYWTKGSIAGMTRGYVSRAWAKAHHLAWYRQVEAREERKAP